MANIKVIHPRTWKLIELPVMETYLLPGNSSGFVKYYRVGMDDMPTDWPGYSEAYESGATHYDFCGLDVEEGF